MICWRPICLSNDRGKTWTYQASGFPPIGGGQRLVLMRLHEGPLLLVSFTGERNDTTGSEFVVVPTEFRNSRMQSSA